MTDDLERARHRREQKRTTAPAGNFGVDFPRQIQITREMDKIQRAERRKGAPTPERITIALDWRDLYGPEVDEALGGQEPMVDEWETGERIPTDEQMQALAWLTDFPIDFFYLPPPPPMPGLMLCGEDGCGPLDGAVGRVNT